MDEPIGDGCMDEPMGMTVWMSLWGMSGWISPWARCKLYIILNLDIESFKYISEEVAIS